MVAVARALVVVRERDNRRADRKDHARVDLAVRVRLAVLRACSESETRNRKVKVIVFDIDTEFEVLCCPCHSNS